MSITLMSRVWETALPSTQKMVLLALADNANDQGRSCYPSVKLLSEKCTITPRAVQKNISILEAAGLIIRKIRVNVVSEYALNVKLIAEMAATEESRRDKDRAETEWRIANSRKNFSTEIVDNSAVACGEQYSPHRENNPEPGCNPRNDACGEHCSPPPEPRSPLVSFGSPPPEPRSPVLSFGSPITTIEPSLNHHNNSESYPPDQDQEPPRGCGGDSEIDSNQAAPPEPIWPSCSIEDKAAIDGLLAALPLEQHQTLLDEVEGARAAGSIRLGLVPFAGGIVRAMLNGSFTPGHSPGVAARRREIANENLRQPSIRTIPDISASDLERGQAVLSKILGTTHSDPQKNRFTLTLKGNEE